MALRHSVDLLLTQLLRAAIDQLLCLLRGIVAYLVLQLHLHATEGRVEDIEEVAVGTHPGETLDLRLPPIEVVHIINDGEDGPSIGDTVVLPHRLPESLPVLTHTSGGEVGK